MIICLSVVYLSVCLSVCLLVCLSEFMNFDFFGFKFGELPYRSIRFHLSTVNQDQSPEQVTINYTDEGPYTRESWWHNIPGHHVHQTGNVLRTVEEPCDYKDNNKERYYPVKTHDQRFDNVYQEYQCEAKKLRTIQFIGRCGTYQYLDMHQVINQSLMNVSRWLENAA